MSGDDSGQIMIKTILFDFDGVILDSVDTKTSAFEDIYMPHGKDVAARVVEHHKANGGMSRFEKFRLYHKKFLGLELSDEEVGNLSEKFSQAVVERVLQAPYLPGVREFLEKYYKDFQFWVITATPQTEIEYICNRLGLSHFFRGILGSPAKKPELISGLIGKRMFSPSEAVFIGDSPNDWEAARKTGLEFILFENDDNKVLFKDFHGKRLNSFYGFEKVINAD